VDSRFTTQSGIYEILEQADAVPGVLDIYIGRWLAWPAVKVLIYARLCNVLAAEPIASPERQRLMRGVSLFGELPSTWLRLRSALAALPPPGERPRIAWMSGAYRRRDSGGVERDALFGDVPAQLAPDAEQIWLMPPASARAAGGIDAEGIYQTAAALANQLTSLQRFRPAVRRVSRQLAEKLSAVTPTVAGLSWYRVCLDALTMFEARRIVWSTVFARIKPAVVLLTNAPYQVGEVAAAKAGGALVGEFQHGLFGPRCPEYGWPGSLAPRRNAMAVADRLFVFGDLFRGGALKNAFWRADEVRVVGSAEIERLRASARPGPPGPVPQLLFMTQPMTRLDAIAFFDEFLGGVQSGKHRQALLTIKVHPSERHAIADYAALAARYPSLCRIADVDVDAGQLMFEHDLVISYTSYALIEAAGLGRPAISISGPQAPGGVFALCPIPGAADAIPTVATADELAALIQDAPARPPAHGFFAEQSPRTLQQAILELLRSSGASVTAHS
jgi:hypothetical protein